MSYLFIGRRPISDTMETANALDVRSSGLDPRSTALPVPAHLNTLRTAIDERLSELEAVLADPSRGESLEALILDLARLATAEAQQAAAHAYNTVREQSDAALADAAPDPTPSTGEAADPRLACAYGGHQWVQGADASYGLWTRACVACGAVYSVSKAEWERLPAASSVDDKAGE